MAAPDDRRLAAGLEMLRLGLGTYLQGLRSLWNGTGTPAGPGDVERILVAAGSEPVADEECRRLAGEVLASGQATPAGPLGRLAGALGLSVGEELLVAAAWWSEADPQFATVLGCAHDDGSRRFASARLIRLVMGAFDVDVPPAVDERSVLVRYGVLEAGAGALGPLRLTATARELLAGIGPARLAAPPLPERLLGMVEPLAVHLRSGAAMVVLRGLEGVGRRSLAGMAVRVAGMVPIAGDRPAGELRLLSRLGIAVPVVDIAIAETLTWATSDQPVILLAPPRHRSAATRQAYVVDVDPPGRTERAAYWTEALVARWGDEGRAGAQAVLLAQRFGFTERDVDAVLARAAADAAWRDTPLDEEAVWSAARRQPEHALERLAALVVPVFGLDDLVLPDATAAQLRDLLGHVTLQHVVLDRWGFRRRLPRGQGVAALFAGPPGTGKTMAAEALAAALRQDLYRVDLAAVVSKYIGETEKNLSAAFDEAERAGAVLFFDEADAIFGKRTEVRDAHDRYANLEINYLLQRVELFGGLVVLATNRQAALDEAFLRRLRFVIRFDMPDAALRRRLWEQSFPPETATDGLNWDSLAAAELAGGHIQHAALHAAFMAAGNGGVVTAAHVGAALQREYEKLGRSWSGLPDPGRGLPSRQGPSGAGMRPA